MLKNRIDGSPSAHTSARVLAVVRVDTTATLVCNAQRASLLNIASSCVYSEAFPFFPAIPLSPSRVRGWRNGNGYSAHLFRVN